jgi:hypothetical protein
MVLGLEFGIEDIGYTVYEIKFRDKDIQFRGKGV